MAVEVEARTARGSERQDEAATRVDLLQFEGLTLDLAGRTLTAADGRAPSGVRSLSSSQYVVAERSLATSVSMPSPAGAPSLSTDRSMF